MVGQIIAQTLELLESKSAITLMIYNTEQITQMKILWRGRILDIDSENTYEREIVAGFKALPNVSIYCRQEHKHEACYEVGVERRT